MSRKKYNKELKAQIAIDALKGQRTIAELASEYGVHPNQINTWKRQLLDTAPDAEKKEQERDQLYQKVGKLQVEVDWLKKKTGYLG